MRLNNHKTMRAPLIIALACALCTPGCVEHEDGSQPPPLPEDAVARSELSQDSRWSLQAEWLNAPIEVRPEVQESYVFWLATSCAPKGLEETACVVFAQQVASHLEEGYVPEACILDGYPCGVHPLPWEQRSHVRLGAGIDGPGIDLPCGLESYQAEELVLRSRQDSPLTFEYDEALACEDGRALPGKVRIEKLQDKGESPSNRAAD